MAKTKTTRNAAPLGVLIVTKGVLKKFISGRSPLASNLVNLTPRATAAADTTATKTASTGSNRRGRMPGLYFTRKRNLPKDTNTNIVKVFKVIRAQKGITQKDLVKRSRMPNSTVWNALQKLRKNKAVEFRAA